jgi:Ca-activated chloride channel family protein
MKKLINIFFALFFLACLSVQGQKQPVKTRILFILDASQSMLGQWEGQQKIKIATSLLSDLMDSLKHVKNVQVALRVYGHQFSVAQGKRSCEDTKLEVPFSYNNYEAIKKKLKSLHPVGTTPIAYSLQKSADDFPSCSNCRNIIILITDGIEECDGDPCAVALALQKNNIVLKPFVIGMGLDLPTIEAFKCVGNFYDVQNTQTFKNVLNIVISQAMNKTTVQVNLLDIYGNPTETNVNMTFYDHFSKQIRNNYVHTINHRGNPDTIPLDPLGSYDLVVHTLPPVRKDSIVLTPGKHNIIALDAPQGDMNFKMPGYNEYEDLKIIVRKKGEMKTLYVQDFNETQIYLVGEYDLEILTFPRINLTGVKISQSHTTTIQFQNPGVLNLTFPGGAYASLYQENNNKLIWLKNFNPNITRYKIVMQPGKYRVIYRPINAKKSIYTEEKTFEIKSGASTNINF